MKNRNKRGEANTIVLGVILLALALVAALAFGYWAYTGRQDYKNNSDKKAAAAVSQAVKQQADKDNADFTEKEKLPNKTFKGPATYGTVTFAYPKTWSAYVDQRNNANPIAGLFYPDVVPAPAQTTLYSLRTDLVGMTYDTVLKQFTSFIKKGTLRASAYIPPSMTQIPNVQTGTRLDGEIETNVQGSMVVMKVRDKTLKIYTESPVFLSDFNNIVLNSLTFIP